MRPSSTLLIQKCCPHSWKASSMVRAKSTSSSSTTSKSEEKKKGVPVPQPLFKADDVQVAEALRNAQYQQQIRNASSVSPPVPAHNNAQSTTADRDCQRCGKKLTPPPTVNSTSNLLHCSDCQMLYSTGGSSTSATQKYDGRVSDYLKRPPYPSEIAKYLDKFVVGQHEAKRTLSVGIYQHYKRLANNHELKRQQSGSAANGQTAGPLSNTHHQHISNNNVPSNMFQQGSYGSSFAGDSSTIAQLSVPSIRSTPLQNGMNNSPPYTAGTNFTCRNLQQDDDEGIRLEKSNIMLLGPSGVGKTFVTQVLARILDVPIALCDATSLTQAGYVGEDVESVLQKLLQNAGGVVEKAQQGIVFLDEIDKIAATGDSASHSYRDVSGEGVQHAFLKLVEGCVVNVKNGRKTPGQQDTVPMDTTDILFVSSGAFSGLEKIVGKRLDKRAVGFGTASSFHSITNDDITNQQLVNEKRDQLFTKADQGDLIKFGMVPELVGRFPIIVPFHSLNQQLLVRVLTEPKNSLLAQMKLQFSLDNVELDFAAEALEEIAQLALERKTGARALRSIIEKVLLLAKFEVPGTDIEAVHITKDCVRGNGSYIYRRREENPEQKVASAGYA